MSYWYHDILMIPDNGWLSRSLRGDAYVDGACNVGIRAACGGQAPCLYRHAGLNNKIV